MEDANDFDVSQLRWWRCVAVDSNNKIQTFIIEVNPGNVYGDFNKIRRDLRSKNLRFVEAKPISTEEILAAKKLSRLKKRKQEYAQGLRGKRYSPLSRWQVVLFVALLFLLILWLAYLH